MTLLRQADQSSTRCRRSAARSGHVAVLVPWKAHVIEADVLVDGGGLLDDVEQALAVAVVGRADVRPVEVRLVPRCRRPLVVEREQVLLAFDRVVAETRHHVDRARNRFGRAAGHVFDLVEPAVELRPVDFLLVARDDPVHARFGGSSGKSFGSRRRAADGAEAERILRPHSTDAK